MKIALLYIRVLKKSDPNFPVAKDYQKSSLRFLDTYKTFKPEIPHDLIVANCGQKEHDGMFDKVATSYMNYNGGGYDCGTYQAVGGRLDHDLVFGLNTHTWFRRKDWMDRFVITFKRCGPGVYGPTASYENAPHLRTPAIAFSPKIMRYYPIIVDNRQKCCNFEAGPNNFSLWAEGQGWPVCLITTERAWARPDWRKPKNGFRDGDQSNVLIYDRHTDLYDAASEQDKRILERAANGTHQ